MWCAERTLLNLNKGRSGFPRLREYWMPAGACPERSRRAGMTSFPRKRESRKLRRQNYAHASCNIRKRLPHESSPVSGLEQTRAEKKPEPTELRRVERSG